MKDAVVVGGGVIGLAIAWRTAQRGLTVAVVDPAPGSGASHHAAGLLAPVTEAHYGEEPLIALNVAAARSYAAFVDELRDATGDDVGYRACGTLGVAFDTDDRTVLTELHAFQQRIGLRSELLTSRDCRALEPMLAPTVRGGLFVADDHQVDNRRLVEALLTACRHVGVTFVTERARALQLDGERVVGVITTDGTPLSAGAVVLAAGAWCAELAGLPAGTCPPVRPVKGQILRLHGPRDFLAHNVRALVTGTSVYLVPRTDGELVVGATVEEQAFDTTVTAGAVYELLRDARAVVPGTSEFVLVEATAGLRPATPDNAPVVGTTQLAGLVTATGHYRNGILQTPITADGVAQLLTTGDITDVLAPFSPLRFTHQPVN